MNETTNRDILTAVEALGRDIHLFRDMTESRFGLMDERIDSVDKRLDRMDERFDRVDERFDRMDLTLSQHSLALTELAADMTAVKQTLAEHGRKLDRRGERRR
jgi:archaellum component FlaC